MADRSDPDVELLWQEFHQAVNMTSRELLDWLGVEPDLEPSPGPARRAPLGMAVVQVLGKRRTDLTADDLEVMREVVDVVSTETTGVPSDALIADERRRHRLLSIGHDPFKGR